MKRSMCSAGDINKELANAIAIYLSTNTDSKSADAFFVIAVYDIIRDIDI
jgi:hypothetical protein